ncbi:MAG: hypothetical protein ABIH71_04285 [Candidatus Omnitrophota bacterium]|nr:hypothetical protein [Candidatus Omnitrophota bacterium]
MVNSQKKTFIVAGLDFEQRKNTLDAIKKRLRQQIPSQLSIFTFYGKEIDIKTFKDKILTFSFDREKIIIIKDAYNLAKEVRVFLFENYRRIVSSSYVILEIEKDYFQLQRDKKISSDAFFSLLFKEAAIFKVASRIKEVSLEDFKRSARNKDLNSSFYFLERLFEKSNPREIGPLILGVLVREVSYSKNTFDKETKFSYLWEADRAIKEKGIDTKLTIELLLAKLFSSTPALERV